jgi:hypothetical protein
MNKKQATAHRMAALKRIPIVGAAVVLLPLAEAIADSGFTIQNVSDPAAWRNLGLQIRYKYTGIDGSGNFDGARAVATYLPMAVYAGVKKTGLSKPVSRVLAPVHLRF